MFFKGVTFPAVQALISKWLPGPERSRLGAFIWGGKQHFNQNLLKENILTSCPEQTVSFFTLFVSHKA
jgi:hypothetical protein